MSLIHFHFVLHGVVDPLWCLLEVLSFCLAVLDLLKLLLVVLVELVLVFCVKNQCHGFEYLVLVNSQSNQI